MEASDWIFTNSARKKLLNNTFDLENDSFKMALFLSSSNIGPGSTSYAGLTNEHANGNGYTTGGEALTLSLDGTTLVTWDAENVVWTADGGPITARYAVIYEVGGDVLCYCELDATPADVTVSDGNPLTVGIHANGVLALS